MIGTILALIGKRGRQVLWNGLGNLWNRYTGSGLTGSEREANSWSAEQAQIQRDWETEMSNTAYQRQVKDMQAAGLNPALMYGGAGSSGATTPNASSPSSVSPQSGGLSDLFGSIMDMALLGAQIKNINADTEQKKAGAERDKSETERTRTLTPIEADKLASDIRKNNQDITESEARASVALANAALIAKETKWYDVLSASQVALNEAYEAEADARRANNEQQIKESEQKILNLKQEIVESSARCAVYAANAGYLDQATVNLMEEQGLIEVRRAGARVEYLINDKILHNYDIDKWFNRAQQGFSALRDAGIAVGSVTSGGLFAPAMPKIGYK